MWRHGSPSFGRPASFPNRKNAFLPLNGFHRSFVPLSRWRKYSPWLGIIDGFPRGSKSKLWGRRSVDGLFFTLLMMVFMAIACPNVLAGSPGMVANNSSLEDLLELSLEELTQVTVTRSPERVADTPATTIIVTQRQIQQRGYFTLKQLLDDLPGLDIGVQGLPFGMSRYSARGIAGINFLKILQDGIPIDSPGNMIFPLEEQYPLHHVKQVEVVYGPGSALYGADAVSLVVNLITEDAEVLDGVETMTAFGEYGDRRVYVKGGKVFGENFSLVAGGHYQEADNVNMPARYPNQLPFGDLRQADGSLFQLEEDRAGYFGDTSSYSAFAKLNMFENFQTGFTLSRFETPSFIGELPNVVNYEPSNLTIIDQTSAYGRYRHQFTQELGAQLQVDYQKYQVDEDSSLADIFTGYEEQFIFEESEKWGIELQGDYTLSADHQFLGGLVFQVFNAIPRTELLADPYDPDKDPEDQVQYFTNTNDMVAIPIFDLDWTNVGVFGQWRGYWTEDLSSVIGLRFDQASTYGGAVSPRVGLVYQAGLQTTLKGFYGRAFAQPSPTSAFAVLGGFDGTTDGQGRYLGQGFVLPNPDLDAQTLDNVEVNLSHRFPFDLRVTLTGYYNHIKDFADFVFVPGPNAEVLPGAVVSNNFILDNVGTLQSYGSELLLDYAQTFGEVGVRVWGSYSFVDGSLKRDDSSVKTDLPFTAMHKVKGGVTLAYQDLISLTPRVRYIGKTDTRASSQTDPNELVEIPEFVVVDLLAEANLLSLFPRSWTEWTGISSLSTFVRITNLLNTNNFGPVSLLPTQADQWPYDPRRTWIGLRLAFP